MSKLFNAILNSESEPFWVKPYSNGNVSIQAVNSVGSIEMEYKLEGSSSGWIEYTEGTDIAVQQNKKIYFRGDNESFSESDANYHKISCSVQYEVGGNLASLVSKTGNFTWSGSMFRKLFYSQATIISQKKLVLPKSTVENCYQNMFLNCIRLQYQPSVLPQLTQQQNCYRNMFQSCTALTQQPKLPQTTLNQGCYQNMFQGCTALTGQPELPQMTLNQNCYADMFNGCASLAVQPELPQTTLVDGCYNRMFKGCSSLNSISVKFTEWSTSTKDWVSGVQTNGVFNCSQELDTTTRDQNHIPQNWNVVNY